MLTSEKTEVFLIESFDVTLYPEFVMWDLIGRFCIYLFCLYW